MPNKINLTGKVQPIALTCGKIRELNFNTIIYLDVNNSHRVEFKQSQFHQVCFLNQIEFIGAK